jgi:hypothetical protein
MLKGIPLFYLYHGQVLVIHSNRAERVVGNPYSPLSGLAVRLQSFRQKVTHVPFNGEKPYNSVAISVLYPPILIHLVKR